MEGEPTAERYENSLRTEMNSEDLTSPGDGTELVDSLQRKLGGYGRYQIIIYIALAVVYMRGCWHALVPIYEGYDPGYHCQLAPGVPLNQSVPYVETDGVWGYDQCTQYVNFTLSNATEDCQRGWHYNFEDGTTSIVSEYEMTCDRRYLNALSTTMYMVGATCGVVFLSPLSERFGGKPVMLVCLWVQLVVGIILPWAGHIGIFMMLKFFIGICNMTIALCVAVMLPETFDTKHREIAVLGLPYFWALGIMTLSLFAYLLPNWKDLQLLITLPINVLSVLYIWIIPQSLPWLISKGRLKQARHVIERFLSINSLPAIPNLEEQLLNVNRRIKIPEDNAFMAISEGRENVQTADDQTSSVLTDSEGQAKNYSVFHILTFRKLRIYAFILSYLFLVNSLAYFGILYSTPLLNGDRFLNLFYSGLVEIPAYSVCIVTHKYIGRRRSICMFLFICAVSNIIITFLPDMPSNGVDMESLQMALYFIGKFGITGSYSAIYLYACEIFPTVIRNQGVGFCSFFENIGSIAAPLIVDINKERANLPLTVFGVLSIVGSLLVLFLPETHDRHLPQTIEDVEEKE